MRPSTSAKRPILAQSIDLPYGNGLIAIIRPETKAPLASPRLEREEPRRVDGAGRSRGDHGEPVFDEGLAEVAASLPLDEEEAGRKTAPAVVRSEAPHRDGVPGTFKQPRVQALPRAGAVGQAKPDKAHDSP